MSHFVREFFFSPLSQQEREHNLLIADAWRNLEIGAYGCIFTRGEVTAILSLQERYCSEQYRAGFSQEEYRRIEFARYLLATGRITDE